MEVEVNQPVKVKLKTLSMHVKAGDRGNYMLKDNNGNVIKDHDGYVPGFFPGEHYGDYIVFEIDLETGLIENWKKPTVEQIQKFINPE